VKTGQEKKKTKTGISVVIYGKEVFKDLPFITPKTVDNFSRG
jgi:hypothetical protein